MKYKKVIDLLTETKDKINTILTGKDDEHHRLKLEADLQRDIKYLSLLTQTDASGSNTDMPTFGPATTIAGKPIQAGKEHVSREQLEPNEEKVQVLRGKVEKAYSTFLQTESIVILKEYEENVIRGVAKKAKMRVTKEEPETITLEFVEEIKKSIIEMEHRDQTNQQQKDAAQQSTESISIPAGNFTAEQVNEQIEQGNQAAREEIQQPDIDQADVNTDKTAREEIEQGTQADVNDKGAAAAQDMPSVSENREQTTSTPDVAKTPGNDEKPKGRRNQQS